MTRYPDIGPESVKRGGVVGPKYLEEAPLVLVKLARPPVVSRGYEMRLTIALDREADGSWIAKVPELNVLLSGNSKQDAIQRAQSAAREIVLDLTGATGLFRRLRQYPEGSTCVLSR